MMEQSSIAGTATGVVLSPALSAAAVTYAEAVRKISRTTLERLGVGSGTGFFPELNRKSEALVFPYKTASEVVNWKAAAFPVKAFTSKRAASSNSGTSSARSGRRQCSSPRERWTQRRWSRQAFPWSR